MELGGLKRGTPEGTVNDNGGTKRSKQEVHSNSSGLGSKTKPCTKFFSTSGCPFGESCHFLHNVPGGFKAVSQMPNLGGNAPLPNFPPPRNYSAGSSSFPDSSSPTVKNRLCNKFNSAEGCKFGDKCHFAHGEWELGKPSIPSYEDPRALSMGRAGGGGHYKHPHLSRPQGPPSSSFGSSVTTKISVDAKLTGAIIGKNGVNSKQVSNLTGVRLSIRDHDTDPNLRNIELEGSFEQIQHASAMVRELMGNASSSHRPAGKMQKGGHNPMSNFKTKLCDNFTKGSCTFGDRCHFAHGAHELKTPGA